MVTKHGHDYDDHEKWHFFLKNLGHKQEPRQDLVVLFFFVETRDTDTNMMNIEKIYCYIL